MVVEMVKKYLGQDFIFNAIIPALYTFQWKCYNLS